MSPFLSLILTHLLDYIFSHADEIKDAIYDAFPSLRGDDDVEKAVCSLTAEPTEERIAHLENVIADKGEDSSKVAAVVLNQATAEV